ncbi:MAG: BlaI/MecI/CopY family transcriptional regulator [Planctomycetota bacterium]|nr:BlaI/MecI/CopY family transcriptional regulator [Planctomycetota bacterium]
MPDETANVTAAELRILKVLWRIESGAVRDVLDEISTDADERPAYTTVMTLMNQLAAKGALEVDRRRQPFVYRPLAPREQVLGHRLKQFLNTVFDGQAGELVLRLVEDADLSPAELRRIEARIEARESNDAGQDPGPPSSPSKGDAP